MSYGRVKNRQVIPMDILNKKGVYVFTIIIAFIAVVLIAGCSSSKNTVGEAARHTITAEHFSRGVVYGNHTNVTNATNTTNNTGNNASMNVTQMQCGEHLTYSTILGNDLLNCSDIGIVITRPGVTLDCRHHLIAGSNSTQGVGIKVLADNVNVDGCDIANFKSGIQVYNANNATLTNNRIGASSRESNDYEGGISGIYLYNSSYSRVDSNDLSVGTGYTGVFVNGGGFNEITNNQVSWRVVGIRLMLSSNNRVSYNHVRKNLATGIELYEGSTHNIISYNLVSRNTMYGIISNSFSPTYNTIESNTIRRCAFGISSQSGDIVRDNTVVSSLFGIDVTGRNASVVDNYIQEYSKAGIRVTGQGNEITSNSFYGNGNNSLNFSNTTNILVKARLTAAGELITKGNHGCFNGESVSGGEGVYYSAPDPVTRAELTASNCINLASDEACSEPCGGAVCKLGTFLVYYTRADGSIYNASACCRHVDDCVDSAGRCFSSGGHPYLRYICSNGRWFKCTYDKRGITINDYTCDGHIWARNEESSVGALPNPLQSLPKKCQFGQGFACIDHQLLKTGGTYPGKLTILLNNGLGNDVEVTSFNFTSDNNKVICAQNNIGLTLPAGSEEKLSVTCTKLDLSKGVRVKGTMMLSYKDSLSGFTHTIPGTLLTDIE